MEGASVGRIALLQGKKHQWGYHMYHYDQQRRWYSLSNYPGVPSLGIAIVSVISITYDQ